MDPCAITTPATTTTRKRRAKDACPADVRPLEIPFEAEVALQQAGRRLNVSPALLFAQVLARGLEWLEGDYLPRLELALARRTPAARAAKAARKAQVLRAVSRQTPPRKKTVSRAEASRP